MQKEFSLYACENAETYGWSLTVFYILTIFKMLFWVSVSPM